MTTNLFQVNISKCMEKEKQYDVTILTIFYLVRVLQTLIADWPFYAREIMVIFRICFSKKTRFC